MIRLRWAFVLLALLAAWSPAAAQPPADSQDAWRREAAEIVARLEQMEQRVLADPELRRMDQALGAELMAGILAADPALAGAAERLPRLDAELDAARRRGDAAAARRAGAEMAGMQRRFDAARAAALADPELEAKVRVFHSLLRARMLDHDPAAARLIERLEVLERRLTRERGP